MNIYSYSHSHDIPFLIMSKTFGRILYQPTIFFFVILSLIDEKYQLYRSFDTNTDLLQTQKCQKSVLQT